LFRNHGLSNKQENAIAHDWREQYLDAIFASRNSYSSDSCIGWIPDAARVSFQPPVDALVQGLRNHRGELLLSASLRGIDTGIRLGNGQRIQARLVISNAAAQHGFTAMY
jgi:hypothetical protein